jgi:hypothetical protein
VRNGPLTAPLAGLTLAVIAWPSGAVASSVAPNPTRVSGAFAATSSCGSLAGIGMSWTSIADIVTSVALTSIPAACVGGKLSLTLVGSGNTSLASAGPVTIAGQTLTVASLSGSAVATSVVGAYVSIVGP